MELELQWEAAELLERAFSHARLLASITDCPTCECGPVSRRTMKCKSHHQCDKGKKAKASQEQLSPPMDRIIGTSKSVAWPITLVERIKKREEAQLRHDVQRTSAFLRYADASHEMASIRAAILFVAVAMPRLFSDKSNIVAAVEVMELVNARIDEFIREEALLCEQQHDFFLSHLDVKRIQMACICRFGLTFFEKGISHDDC